MAPAVPLPPGSTRRSPRRKLVLDQSLKYDVSDAEVLQGDNKLLLDGGRTLSWPSTAGASSFSRATWAGDWLVLGGVLLHRRLLVDQQFGPRVFSELQKKAGRPKERFSYGFGN